MTAGEPDFYQVDTQQNKATTATVLRTGLAESHLPIGLRRTGQHSRLVLQW